MPTYVVPKLTRVANASEKKRMSDVIRLMSRQLGEAMMDSLGVRVEDTFSVGIDLEKGISESWKYSRYCLA